MSLASARYRAFPQKLRTIACVAAAAMLLAGGGCHRAMYQAASLPAELAAPRVLGGASIDMTALARDAVRSERIHEGDALEITVATGLEQRETPVWTLRVSEEGVVTVPLVGNVFVAGMELTEAEEAIRRVGIERGIYSNPSVSVTMKERRSNRVTVVGAVAAPGVYRLPAPQSDLLAALVAAQGLTEDAATVVEVRQPPPASRVAARATDDGVDLASYVPPPTEGFRTRSIDLADPSPAATKNLYLEDGAVVMVKKRPPQTIHVLGLVHRPNQFEIPPEQDVRLLDALAMAGGRTMEIADTVRVIRQLPGEDEPVVISASVRAAKRGGQANLRLAPGDVVSVEETPVTFVTQLFRDFFRVGFSAAIPGM